MSKSSLTLRISKNEFTWFSNFIIYLKIKIIQIMNNFFCFDSKLYKNNMRGNSFLEKEK
jgi:hypothetical protein